MHMSQNTSSLSALLPKEDWFSCVELENNRFIVYVHYMNLQVFDKIPKYYQDKQVLVHFEASRSKNYNYTEVSEEDSLNYLNETLDNLETNYDSNVLEHIFYEVHDKQNAITNLSSKYPEAREILDNLYKKYGFDMIYNYLEL